MKPPLRCAVTPLREGELELSRDSARYLLKVHRLRVGESFTAFDPLERTEAEATLTSADKKAATCHVSQLRTASSVSMLPVTLLQAVGKGDKPEQVIRDATQLGAQQVVLVQTERCAVHAGTRHEQRQSRYERVALESARQCGRGDLPLLRGPIALEAALELVARHQLKLLFDARAGAPLARAFEKGPYTSIAVLIGPEGGLSEAEQQDAVNTGFSAVRLGSFVLRTETAAIAALAAIAEHCQRPDAEHCQR